MSSSLVVSQVQNALAQIETIDDAKQSSDLLERVMLVAKQDGYGLQTQNLLALERIRIQREGGTLLLELAASTGVINRTSDGKFDSESYLPAGLSKQEAYRWRRLAEIPNTEIQDYAASMMVKAKEITQSGVLKLASKEPQKQNHSTEVPEYTAPGIDIQMARDFGLEVGDTLVALVLDSLNNALLELENPKHAYAWTKYHGIKETGELGEQWSFEGIGAKLGATREYAESLYYRASSHLYKRMYIDALNQIRALLDAEI